MVLVTVVVLVVVLLVLVINVLWSVLKEANWREKETVREIIVKYPTELIIIIYFVEDSRKELGQYEVA